MYYTRMHQNLRRGDAFEHDVLGFEVAVHDRLVLEFGQQLCVCVGVRVCVHVVYVCARTCVYVRARTHTHTCYVYVCMNLSGLR